MKVLKSLYQGGRILGNFSIGEIFFSVFNKKKRSDSYRSESHLSLETFVAYHQQTSPRLPKKFRILWLRAKVPPGAFYSSPARVKVDCHRPHSNRKKYGHLWLHWAMRHQTRTNKAGKFPFTTLKFYLRHYDN